MTEMTRQQREALDKINDWYLDTVPGDDLNAPFRLFGPAGTGKTTLAREVSEALGGITVAFAAYTGKAASVLRGKGCEPASTLHSLIYRPQSNAETKAKLRAAEQELTEQQAIRESGLLRGEGQDWADDMSRYIAETQEHIEQLEREAKTMGWVINEMGPLAVDRPDLLILDEVSMVDAKLAADLESFGIPLLVLGDPEQLPPVGGEGYYTNAVPDFLLTEIHRQALKSPVLRLATAIRQGAALGQIEAVPHSVKLAAEHDQVLCWKNATRWTAVKKLRELAGLGPLGTAVAGDRVMCLTNNRDLAIYNGQQFEVVAADPGTLGPRLTLKDDAGVVREMLAFSQGFEGREQQDQAKSAYLGGKGLRGLFTYAQAITVHKAQGSEWGSVYIVDETPGMISMSAKRVGQKQALDDARRWMYTAVTRAADKVTVVRTGRGA